MKAKSLPLVGALVLTGTVLILTLAYWLEEPDISDSIGYIQASHQLAQGQGLAYVDPHNNVDRRFYTLYAFKVVHPEDRNLYFSLSPGTPVLAAALEKLMGNPMAIHWLVPGLAAALVFATFLLGTLLVSDVAGFWAAIALSMTATFLQFSSAFWSEVPSAAFLYIGCVFCAVALHTLSENIWSVGLTVLGGLMIGASCFMRFSNVSVVPALLVLVWGLFGWSNLKQWRVVGMSSATLLALFALLVFNTAYYGGPFVTGYSPRHGWYDQPAFSLAYAFGPSFVSGRSVTAMAFQLARDLGGLLLFSLMGLVGRPRWVGGWWFSLALLALAPYAVYAFAPDGINARFIIPALPAICLLIGQGIVTAGKRLPEGGWRWALGLALAISMMYGLPGKLKDLEERNQSALATVQHAIGLAEQIEPNAVVMSYTLNDMIAVYGHRSVLNYRHMPPYDPVSGKYQYTQFEELLVSEVEKLLAQNVPVYYVVDSQPSLYKSEEILRRHFDLVALREGEPIYRIERQGS